MRFQVEHLSLASTTTTPKICIASDIHFSYLLTNRHLSHISQKLKSLTPDYIFVPGDLIDSNEMIFDPKEEIRLLNFLKSLATYATVIISLGNHDFYRKVPRKNSTNYKDQTWRNYKNTRLIQIINTLENVFLLDNAIYEDENIFVLGFTQQPVYYHLSKKSSTSNLKANPKNLSRYHENYPELIRELKSLHSQKLSPLNQTNITLDHRPTDQNSNTNTFSPFNDLPSDKLKFALIHAPLFLSEPEIQEYFKEYDWLISGHMHGGIVPPLLNRLWRSSKGIITPDNKTLLPINTRTSKKTLAKKLIISHAITTFHECVKPLNYLNIFYPPFITVLSFKRFD